MPSIRLSKFLSQSGFASRRKCDIIIDRGRVKVNDIVILDPFYQVKYDEDVVSIDGQVVNRRDKSIYIALYKPKNYLSDLIDDKNRNVARKLIPINTYLFPIGRLDYNSEGLMLFSNDGDLANRIMHPRFGIEKEYFVKFKGELSNVLKDSIKTGINIDGTIYKVALVEFLKSSLSNTWYKIVLREGKNRMIRKIGSRIGHPVLKLIRMRIGCIKLESLKPGEYRFLKENEIIELEKLFQNNINLNK